jgi:hypothetical protein
MKMFKLKQVACAATVATGLAFGMASATAAPTIGFGAAVDNGATVSVDVVVGDLGNQIVSAYDLDVSFDTGALAFFGLTFSAALGGPDDALEDQIVSPGLVDFASISLLGDDQLLALQNGGPVTLATLEFTGDDASSLAFANWGMSNNVTNDVKGLDNRVIIPGGSVPEPATYMLVSLALAGVLVSNALRRGRERRR